MAEPRPEHDPDREQRPPDEPHRDDAQHDEDLIDEAAMDSFPASDPPSWAPTRAGDPDAEPLPEERPGGQHDP